MSSSIRVENMTNFKSEKKRKILIGKTFIIGIITIYSAVAAAYTQLLLISLQILKFFRRTSKSMIYIRISRRAAYYIHICASCNASISELFCTIYGIVTLVAFCCLLPYTGTTNAVGDAFGIE